MNFASVKTQRVLNAAAIAGLCSLPMLLGGCNKTESKTTEENKKVVETPEGTKTVTETTEKKVTTEGK